MAKKATKKPAIGRKIPAVKPAGKSNVKPSQPARPVAAARPAAKPAAPATKAAQTPSKSSAPAPKIVAPPAKFKPAKPLVKKLPPSPPVILPTPVPTDGKPRKNQAGLNSKELETYRSALLAKRRELVGDMSSMEREALRSASGSNLSNLPMHMADMGTDNYEQEFTLGLVEKDRQLLREINSALGKIQDGTYGLCEGTGKPISKARLEAQPWAKYSIEHARALEKGGIRR